MSLLWGIVTLLIVLWLLGVIFSFGGGLIHILLVVALVIIVYRLFKGK